MACAFGGVDVVTMRNLLNNGVARCDFGGMYQYPLYNICVRLVILGVDTGCVEFSFPLGAIRPF